MAFDVDWRNIASLCIEFNFFRRKTMGRMRNGSNPSGNTETTAFPPGSNLALKNGCNCAVMDNHYGRGFGNPPRFWINEDCPLHGAECPEPPDEEYARGP